MKMSILSIVAIVAAIACSGQLAWGAPSGANAPIVHVVTDIHYLAKNLHDDGNAFNKLVYEGDGKNTELIHDILDAYRYTLQKEKPDILLVTGDLTLNGEKASHLALASWFKAVESLSVKVFVLPGNHDILNPWARGYSGDQTYKTENVSPEEFRSIYRAYGFDEAIARDNESLSYVVEPISGLRIFMLDSCLYSDNLRLGHPESGGSLGYGTLDWILANLKEAKRAGARVLVAMHHSAVDHNPFISEGYTVYDADFILARFLDAGIIFTLTGHVHIQDISEQTTPLGTFRDIATNSLSVYPHNYGKIQISLQNNRLSYRSFPVNVETWAREERIGDDRLTRFEAYSWRFFRDRSAFMVNKMLAGSDVQLPAERAQAFADLLGTLNERFFAGNAYLNALDAVHSEAYQDLVKTDYGFLSAYVQSIIEDPSPENNKLDIGF